MLYFIKFRSLQNTHTIPIRSLGNSTLGLGGIGRREGGRYTAGREGLGAYRIHLCLVGGAKGLLRGGREAAEGGWVRRELRRLRQAPVP